MWTPALIVKFGSIAMIFCLIIVGLCQGLVIPMLSDFVSRWAPVSERTPLGTFIFASKLNNDICSTFYIILPVKSL